VEAELTRTRNLMAMAIDLKLNIAPAKKKVDSSRKLRLERNFEKAWYRSGGAGHRPPEIQAFIGQEIMRAEMRVTSALKMGAEVKAESAMLEDIIAAPNQAGTRACAGPGDMQPGGGGQDTLHNRAALPRQEPPRTYTGPSTSPPIGSRCRAPTSPEGGQERPSLRPGHEIMRWSSGREQCPRPTPGRGAPPPRHLQGDRQREHHAQRKLAKASNCARPATWPVRCPSRPRCCNSPDP